MTKHGQTHRLYLLKHVGQSKDNVKTPSIFMYIYITSAHLSAENGYPGTKMDPGTLTNGPYPRVPGYPFRPYSPMTSSPKCSEISWNVVSVSSTVS